MALCSPTMEERLKPLADWLEVTMAFNFGDLTIIKPTNMWVEALHSQDRARLAKLKEASDDDA